MELGKYKLAMRPKKYLTREFVVYKAAPEAMDDVITEEQNIIDTMPSQAPAMDNYMPEIPGMEDPSLRQVELADGGVVQREGFKDGVNYNRNLTGKNQYEQKSIEEIIDIIKNNPNYNAKDLRGKTKINKIPLLTRRDIERAEEKGVKPGFSGKHIDPEKERARDRLRRESIKSKSSPAMEQAIGGTKEKNLSHAGRKNTPVSLENLMYTDASLNRRMLHPFEKPLEEAMTKFEKVYNSDASPEVKRKAAFELQKFDRELRKKYPEYAKLKTRFQFKNSAFEPGFVFKEKLPDPSLAISNEPGTSLKGINPKSKKGEELTKIANKKLETLVSNIGLKKINAGKLNKNEFNLLQRAVKSPAVKQLGSGVKTLFKGLGIALTPLVFYDTYTAYKEGKPISEALEYGLFGTNIIGGTRDELKLTPREREARGVQQQYEREQQDVSGLSSDFYFPSDLSVNQAAKIYKQGQDRVAAERAAEEKQAALENVYQGDPGILDYSEYAYGGRVGLAAGTIPKAVSWVAKRIQEINKLIKTRRAKAEDFLDEIEILNKAEELDLTKEQVGQILRQQKQASTEKYLKRPIEGDPDLESRLPYDPNATPRNIKRGNFEKGGDPKDKAILPINPMMDEGPQDPSKRTFIQGAGGVGLAGLLLGTGLLKLGKSAAVPSKIGSMIKNTTAPSWMEALITKVMKEGTDIPIPKKPGATAEKISIKELEFKNPENGKTETITLKIDETKDSIDVDYMGYDTLGGKGVNFKISPKEEIVYSKDGKYLTSKKVKDEYKFYAHEAEPQVVNWDGDIEFDGEVGVNKIIDLNSDISGLKSFVTGGKGVDKKVAKIKKETVDKIEKNPAEYIEEGFDYSYYDPSLPTE